MKRLYWIILHETGGVWPQTFSFFNSQAVLKIRKEYGNQSWRSLKRKGFSLHKVKLKRP